MHTFLWFAFSAVCFAAGFLVARGVKAEYGASKAEITEWAERLHGILVLEENRAKAIVTTVIIDIKRKIS